MQEGECLDICSNDPLWYTAWSSLRIALWGVLAMSRTCWTQVLTDFFLILWSTLYWVLSSGPIYFTVFLRVDSVFKFIQGIDIYISPYYRLIHCAQHALKFILALTTSWEPCLDRRHERRHAITVAASYFFQSIITCSPRVSMQIIIAGSKIHLPELYVAWCRICAPLRQREGKGKRL